MKLDSINWNIRSSYWS